MDGVWLSDGWDSPLAAPPTLGKPPRAPGASRVLPGSQGPRTRVTLLAGGCGGAMTPLTRALRTTDHAFRTGALGGDPHDAHARQCSSPMQLAGRQWPSAAPLLPCTPARGTGPQPPAAASPQLHANELLDWMDAEASYDWGSPARPSAQVRPLSKRSYTHAAPVPENTARSHGLLRNQTLGGGRN
jgi:hypothetical protein